MDLKFKVFTLNCWGLPFVSKDKADRIKAISTTLAVKEYDVVCLQEVWTDKDYQLIRSKVERVLPYSHYFYSGVTGSGVCILSKHPIEETFFHQWSVNGYIHKLHHGDWFGGKGVGLCRLKVGGYSVNVYSAHLHAEYDRECDEYQAHRILQAYDTAQFIALTSTGADLVVLAGDLNTEPGDLAYRLILTVPGLRDAFSEMADLPVGSTATNECPLNSYTPASLVKKKSPGKRIDYVMFRPSEETRATLKHYCLPLPRRVPGCGHSYSDHEAVEATICVSRSEKADRKADYDRAEVASVMEESVAILNEALNRLNHQKCFYFSFAVFFFLVLLGLLIVDFAVSFPVVLYVLKALVTLMVVFCFVMATVWNKIEKHAVYAGKLAMEVTLNRLGNGNVKQES